jgi:Carboxypeptidase regulatory-like domain/TonB dependent receptor
MRSLRTLLMLVVLLATLSSQGQVATTGTITGAISDPTGAYIPGAAVTIESPAMMQPKSMLSDGGGGFTFAQLPPGAYTLKVGATGFQSYVRSNIDLTAGFTANFNVPMTVGDKGEVVDVSAASPLIDVKSTQMGTTFDLAVLQNIPTGRDPWSTISLAPGVTTDQFDVGGSKSYYQSTMSVHGSKPGQMAYSLAGLKLSWPGGAGGSTAFYTDSDSLQELQIVTDSAPAEVSVGGVYINMVPKSGSNALHGSVNGYYDTNAFQSPIKEPLFNGVPVNAGNGPVVMIRDLTANAGGPIIKDRWWVYGGWRYLITSEKLLSIPRPDGSIPISVNHQTNTTFQNDFNINAKNHLGLTWWYNEQNQYFRRNTGSTGIQFTADSAAQRQIEPAYILQGDLTSTLSTHLVLDTRGAYMHLIFPLRYEPSVKPTDIAFQDSTLSTLTGAATSNLVEPAMQWRINQSAQYSHTGWWGSHDFKAGWDYAYNFSGMYANVNQNIIALYNNGVPFEVNQYNGPTRERSIFYEGSIFGQDAWTISHRVTLNLGLRFDHYHAFNPTQTNPEVQFFQSTFPGSRTVTHQDVALWKDVSPRVGATWDIRGNSKSVLRASFGRFDFTNGTSLGESVNPNILGGYTYNWKDLNGDGYPEANEWLTTASGAPATPVAPLGAVATTIDPHIVRPYSYQVVVGYEQQVFGDIRVGATYFYRTNKDQIGRYNLAVTAASYAPITSYTTTATVNGAPVTTTHSIVNPLNGQPLTLYNQIANVGKFNYLTTNIAASNDNNYNALELTALKRFAHNWQLLTGFTYQHNTGTYIGPNTDNFSDPNININRVGSNLDQDATYIFKISGQYLESHTRINLAVNYQHYTGYPIRPTNSFVGGTYGLAQGAETVALAPSTLSEPNVDNASLRVSRPFAFHDRYRVEPTVDLFNFTNSNSITSKVATYGSNFLKPVDLINPRIAKFGLKVSF